MRMTLLAAAAVALVWCCRPAAAQEQASKLGLAAVEVMPQIINTRDMIRELTRNYPRELVRAGLEGQAVLRFMVRSDGSVDASTVSVVEATHPLFGEAAARVAPTMRFSPAQVGGRPVDVRISVPIYFSLEGIDEAKPDSAAPAAP
jgi:TonB family protein